MPETSSNSASLTPLHLEGSDKRFSKLRALRMCCHSLFGKSSVGNGIAIQVTHLPHRNTLNAPHAILISVNGVEDIGVLLEALFLLQLKEVFLPGHSAVAEVQHSARGVNIKPVEP